MFISTKNLNIQNQYALLQIYTQTMNHYVYNMA